MKIYIHINLIQKLYFNIIDLKSSYSNGMVMNSDELLTFLICNIFDSHQPTMIHFMLVYLIFL